jgi:hypothetical protein
MTTKIIPRCPLWAHPAILRRDELQMRLPSHELPRLRLVSSGYVGPAPCQRPLGNPTHRALAHPIARLNFCTRHLVVNSSIDRRVQPQIAVEPFAVLEFRWSLAIGRLQSDAPRPCTADVSFRYAYLFSQAPFQACCSTGDPCS